MLITVAEQRDGRLNRASWEAIAAAQRLRARGCNVEQIVTVVVGATVGAVAADLAAAGTSEVVVIDHPALATYTPDGYTAALEGVLGDLAPSVVFLPHTYQTRDLAPKL